MKKTSFRLLFSAMALSCVYLVACQKEASDTSLISEARGGNGNGNNGIGHGNGGNGGTNAGTASRTCYLGQGYWFASGKHTWPDVNGGTASGSITIGTTTYSQEQGIAIWKSSNAGGLKDAKKAFLLLATIQLSAATVSPTYSGYAADLATVTSWLSGLGTLNPSNLPSAKMDAATKAAYNRLKDWVESHECDGDDDGHDGDDDDDDDKNCPTDISYWLSNTSLPDVNGSTVSGTITIAGTTSATTQYYSLQNLVTVWTTYQTHPTDAQRVLFLLSAYKLAQYSAAFTVPTQIQTDLAVLESWLSTQGMLTATNFGGSLSTAPQSVRDAYNRVTAYIEDHDCD